jgi:hypothetical protein
MKAKRNNDCLPNNTNKQGSWYYWASMESRATGLFLGYDISGWKSHGGGLFRLLEPEIRA